MSRKLQAIVLTAAMLVPASTVLANDWSKPMSRTRGAAIGGTIGAVAGPPGVVVGAAVGNGVQSVRHHAATHHRHHRHHR